MASVYDFSVKTIRGEDQPLDQYKGRVMLIVNVASECGFTPQYEGLEALYEKYKDQGLVVLGFPCNQFGGQEPGTESEIESFCSVKFGVKFPMFAKVDVNGKDEHPLYAYLKKEAPGVLGTKSIKWNFTKFLVARDGARITRYAPNDTPGKIESEVAQALAAGEANG